MIYAIAHLGCTETVRESALKVDSRRENKKSLLAPETHLKLEGSEMFSITRKQCANSFRHNCLTMAAEIQPAPLSSRKPPTTHKNTHTNNNDDNNNKTKTTKTTTTHTHTHTKRPKKDPPKKKKKKKKKKNSNNNNKKNNKQTTATCMQISLSNLEHANRPGFFLVTEERLLGNIENSDEFVQFLLVCATVISLYM